MANPFYVGVWAQPLDSYSKWKAEGVSVIVGPDRESNKRSAQEVRRACKDQGLFYMDSPSDAGDLESLISDPNCLRILLPDEPELYSPNYNVDPAGFQKAVDAFTSKWKPFVDQAKGRKAFFVNFSGPKVTGGRPAYQGQNQKPFGALADEVSADWYPINMNTLRYWDQYNAANVDILPVAMVKCLKEYFPQKPVWSYLEVCDQNLDKTSLLNDPKNMGRGPTAIEIEKQWMDLMAAGISGIIYFADRIGGGLPWDPKGGPGTTAWDGRNLEQASKCKELALKYGATIQPSSDPLQDLQKSVLSLSQRVSALEAEVAYLDKNAVTDVQIGRNQPH